MFLEIQFLAKVMRLSSRNFAKKRQQISLNYVSDIYFKDFIKLYKDYNKEPYSLLVNDTTLPSDNPLRFRKDLLLNEYH